MESVLANKNKNYIYENKKEITCLFSMNEYFSRFPQVHGRLNVFVNKHGNNPQRNLKTQIIKLNL